MKYYYFLRVYCNGTTYDIKQHCPKTYLEGYLDCMEAIAPRNKMELVRSDGKVIYHIEAVDHVYLGQRAGFPNSGHYQRAGEKALARAESLRQQEKGTK